MANKKNWSDQEPLMQQNMLHDCSLKGCSKKRIGLSKYCSSHTRYKALYGHPLLRALRKDDLEPHIKRAQQFIDRNREHRKVKHAMSKVHYWLTKAKVSPSNIAGGKDAQWLAKNQGDPEKVLSSALAFWLFAFENKEDSLWYETVETLEKGIGTVVLTLVARPSSHDVGFHSYLKAKSRKEVGNYFHTELTSFFVAATIAIQQYEDEINLKIPFE